MVYLYARKESLTQMITIFNPCFLYLKQLGKIEMPQKYFLRKTITSNVTSLVITLSSSDHTNTLHLNIIKNLFYTCCVLGIIKPPITKKQTQEMIANMSLSRENILGWSKNGNPVFTINKHTARIRIRLIPTCFKGNRINKYHIAKLNNILNKSVAVALEITGLDIVKKIKMLNTNRDKRKKYTISLQNRLDYPNIGRRSSLESLDVDMDSSVPIQQEETEESDVL